MTTMNEFIAQYYPEYDPKAGVTTTGSANGITMTHKKMTPETHPWAFINPDQADVNGRIYGTAPTVTPTGYQAGRQATPGEISASTTANNYFRNGGKGLDPRLMAGMNRNITPGQKPGDQFRNQYGTYTQQHAIIDPARKAQGLDPWTEMRSRFQGRDQQGNAVNYANQRSLWGNRGPGYHSEPSATIRGSALSQALRNPAGGSTQPPAGGLPPSGNGQLPDGGYVGLPPGHSQFGGPGNKAPQSTPQWWQDMMARKPGGGMT